MRVGADVGALCRKCGDVWHVVVAIANGRIAKVECKQCGARHAYRATDSGAGARPGARERKAPVRKARARPAAPVVEADPSRAPRPYRPSEAYRAGDRVIHPSFGEGVVQALPGPRKVSILFATGEKTLVHARTVSGGPS